MSNKFNLFSLHSSTDVHPRTWICIKGENTSSIFGLLEKEILSSKKICREKLSRILAEKLNCSHSTIKWVLQSNREFYPIPIILELLKFSKNKNDILKKFKKDIQYLKVNSASAKPVKATSRLNKNLAKILGAFMADGSFSMQVVFSEKHKKKLKPVKFLLLKEGIHYSAGKATSRNEHYISIQGGSDNFKYLNKLLQKSGCFTQIHYNIELTEEYKDSVESFTGWIKQEFGIEPNHFSERKNAWRVVFSNKILARYLMTFFEVKPGPKCFTAFEPKIIKKSDIEIRKCFAKGALMFDGSVSKNNKILFSTISKNFHNSIKQIWKKDNIKFGESIRSRKSGYSHNKKIIELNLFTTVNNKKRELLSYFEPKTQKWKLLNWLSGNSNYQPRFKKSFIISLRKILKILQKIEICDTNYLKKLFDCADPTIRSYLKILELQGKIKMSNKPAYINNYVNKKTTVFLKNKFHKMIFKKIRQIFKQDKNFAGTMEVCEGTLSAWRVKNNGIPICILKEMCKILEIDLNSAYKNIQKTNQKIIEII